MVNLRDELKLLTATALFVLIGIVAQQVAISALWGTPGQTFTLFDLMSPIPVAFLGLVNGLAAILIAKLLPLLLQNQPIDPITLVRLLPAVAGGLFFWAYRQKQTLPTLLQYGLPILAIILFWVHPAIWGTWAMLYPLYWLIPLLVLLSAGPLGSWLDKNDSWLNNGHFKTVRRWGAWMGRALGATFTQHAIGGVLWLYTIPASQNPAFWLALIPLVAIERLVFSMGIATNSLGVEAVLQRMTLLYKAITRTPNAQPMPRKKK